MTFFSKKETLLQNMAFMALMAAFNVIASLLCSFSPVIAAFLVLLLPLISTIVELYCKDRYYPIYAFASIGLSIVLTIWNIETTIFYVVPAIITGYIFGLFIKKGLSGMWAIFIATIIQTALSFVSIAILNAVFITNMIDVIKTLINAESSLYIDAIIPSAIFVFSLIQITLSYVIIINEVRKYRVQTAFNKFLNKEWIVALITCVISASIIGFYFVASWICYLMLCIVLFFFCFVVLNLIEIKYWRTLIIFGATAILNIFVFAAGYPLLAKPNGLLLIAFTPFVCSNISLVVSFLKKPQPKD